MRVALSLLLVVLVLSCVSVRGGVLSTRTQPPDGWEILNRAAPTATMKFIIAVKQQNLDALEAKFWAVSDPKSPEYQDFMSVQQIKSLVAPKPEDTTLITEWLVLNGVTPAQIKSSGDALEVSTTVQVAERLFETQFFEYVHKQWKKIVRRQFGSWSIPSGIRSRIDLISGVSNFPPPFNGRHRAKTLAAAANRVQANAAAAVVAQTCYGLYNIGPQTFGNATSISSQGVVEFQGQYFSPSDLATYAKLNGLQVSALTADHIVGTNVGSSPQTEADLDIQLVATVNIEATNWFWIVDNDGWLYEFVTQFFNTTDVPQVVSISYGWWEGDQCRWDTTFCSQSNFTSDQYTARVNTEFQKIGLRGVSILVSSGDSGAHTRSDPYCSATTLYADFPSASPYVTAVGATQLTTGSTTPLSPQTQMCTQWNTSHGVLCAGGGTEEAVSLSQASFTSGGGFSEVADMPSYQTAAVKAYLASGVALPPANMYNASRRARPDIAAVGSYNLIVQSNSVLAVGGTSASSPNVAAIISLLNQASIAKSGKPLGFVNPLLYQIWADQPSAFNDVTVGDNICTEYGCAASCKGWTAAKGWDPVTGLGTPNYGALLNYIQTH